jgi:hypothetical protein
MAGDQETTDNRPSCRTVALLAAAPLRNHHGVIQISSCCVQAFWAGVMFWLKRKEDKTTGL